MKSRDLQFWILMGVSVIVSLLLIRQVFLCHAIIKEQHLLVDAHESAEGGPGYKTAWENLAVSVWRAGQRDPMLIDMLKSEGVGVHEGPPPSSTPAGPNVAPVPSTSSKAEPAPQP